MVPVVGSWMRSRQRPSVVLPEPELADDAEGLAGADLEVDAVDGAQAGREDHAEAADGEDRRPVGRQGRAQDADLGLVLELLGGADQHAGVGVLRIVEDALDRALLHDPAPVHDQHLVGDLGDDAHVVGDEHHRHAVAGLQALDEVEDLGLGGDVEGGGRLVGDEDQRIAGKRHGDHHALAHAAGELEGVAVDRGLGVRDLDLGQQFEHAGAALGGGHLEVDLQRLADLEADAVDRRQRGHRLLEDHRDLAAADVADGAAARVEAGEVGGGAVGAVEADLAGGDAAGAVDDLQDRAGGDGFARARTRRRRRASCRVEGEGDAVDGGDEAGAGRELGAQAGDFEDGRGHPVVP